MNGFLKIPQLSRRDRSMSADTDQRILKTLCATTEVIPSWQMLGCKSSNLEDSMIFDLSFISFLNNGCDLLCYKYMILTDTILSEQGWCHTLYLMSVPSHILDTPIETPSYSLFT